MKWPESQKDDLYLKTTNVFEDIDYMFEGREIMFEGLKILPFKHQAYLQHID